MCTHFLQMHLEYITSVVDLTEMYSRGVYNLGREGQMKTITYCIWKHISLREDTKACEPGPMASESVN